MIKESIQEDKTIVNIYALNIGAPKYMKQIKEEIDKSTIIVGNCNTPLTSVD